MDLIIGYAVIMLIIFVWRDKIRYQAIIKGPNRIPRIDMRVTGGELQKGQRWPHQELVYIPPQTITWSTESGLPTISTRYGSELPKQLSCKPRALAPTSIPK